MRRYLTYITDKKMLVVNLILVAGIFLVFWANTFYSNEAVFRSQRQRDEAMLENLTDKLATETVRMHTLLVECQEDRSVRKLLGGKLNNVDYSNCLSETMEKLNLIRLSLSWATDVYVYVADNGYIYSSSQLCTYNNQLVGTLKDAFDADEKLPEFMVDDPYYCAYRRCAFYVMPVYRYGAVMVQINLDEMLGSNIVGYQLVLLDKNGDYFASTLDEDVDTLRRSNFTALNDGDVLNTEAGRISILRQDKVGIPQFTALLLIDESIAGANNARLKGLTVVGMMVVLLVNILLLVINALSHRPYRELANKYGAGEANSIDYIDHLIDSYKNSNEMIQARMRRMVDAQKILTLNYLANTPGEPSLELSETFARQYSRYFVIYVVVQTEDGSVNEEAFDLCENLLQLSAIAMKENGRIFVIRDDWQREEVMEYLRTSLYESEYRQYIWVGISDWNMGADSFRNAVEQAHRRVLGLPAVDDGMRRISMMDEGKAHLTNVSMEQQNALANHVLVGSRIESEELMKLLTIGKTATIEELQTNIRILIALLLTLKGDKDVSIDMTAENCYNSQWGVNVLTDVFASILMPQEVLSPMLAHDVEEYIAQHYNEELTLESVAADLHVSAAYLSRKFKQERGTNLFAVISELRMKKAGEILNTQSEIKVATLGEMVGISNPATFTRQFKEYYGVTPSQYRHRMQEQKSDSE